MHKKKRMKQRNCDGVIHIGGTVCVPAESYEGSGKRGTLPAVVLGIYGRWALVQTEAGYKTSIWLDERGRAVV